MIEQTELVQTQFEESLKAQTSEKPFMPYLFMGSGMSRRYLDLPDWGGLLRIFADKTGQDFDYLCATYEEDLPKVASEIAREFHEIWWNDPSYVQLKEKYRGRITGVRGALKAAVAEFVASRDQLIAGVPGVDDPHLAAELELLGNVVVDGIITTNYDALSLQVFPKFKTFVGQEELLLGDAQFIAESYKIHGCTTEPDSLILTDEDYREFENKNAYLAAKLLTIFAEHPVIFVGYSLHDGYLNQILDSIARAVSEEKLSELGKRIYFVEWNDSPDCQPILETTSIERGGYRFPITRVETHSYKWIWESLGGLERSFSGPLLRELKSNLYELVATASTTARRETVIAIPLESEEARDQKVVFGVGEFSGVDTTQPITITPRMLEREDLFADILGTAGRPMSDENILEFGIPKQIKPNINQYLPVWKYLDGDGRIDELSGEVNFGGLPACIQTLAQHKIKLWKNDFERLMRDSGGSLPSAEDLINADHKPYFLVTSLLWLAKEGLDISDFKWAVMKIWPDIGGTEKAKLVCVYDRMAYCPDGVENLFEVKD